MAWIGTPDDIRRAIAAYDAEVGGFESASLQVNFGMITQPEAEASMTLFAHATPNNKVFMEALKKYCGGEFDRATLERL